MFVLALPLQAGSERASPSLAFVGGLSAATAMVIVETVALAIMVSNDIVVPLVLQRREALITGRERCRRAAADGAADRDLRDPAARLRVLPLRRRRAARRHRPAVVRRHRAARAGLLRRPDLARATARGAIAGMIVGIADLGLYAAAADLRRRRLHRPAHPHDGPWGIDLLRPQHLFGLDLPPLVHGVVWSLALNILAYVGFSLRRAPDARSSGCRPTCSCRRDLRR